MNLKEVANEYNEFPIDFHKAQDRQVFIHKHGNLDNVMGGADLICRAKCEVIEMKSVMKIKTNQKLKVGNIFLGLAGSKAIANAYVHESTNDYAIIGSMSSHKVD